jgi:plasmid stabilization system protein ParE
MQAIRSLQDNPERCGLAPESEWCPGEIRQLLHGKRKGVYRILFEIRHDAVYILHVRHGAQDLLSPENW